jgi:hypothetical protein
MYRAPSWIVALAVASLTFSGCYSARRSAAGEGNAIGGGSQVFRSLYNAPTDSILVFRAGMLMGGLDVLRMMRSDDVRVVRHISAVDAYHKYGRVVSIGALEIEFVHE